MDEEEEEQEEDEDGNRSEDLEEEDDEGSTQEFTPDETTRGIDFKPSRPVGGALSSPQKALLSAPIRRSSSPTLHEQSTISDHRVSRGNRSHREREEETAGSEGSTEEFLFVSSSHGDGMFSRLDKYSVAAQNSFPATSAKTQTPREGPRVSGSEEAQWVAEAQGSEAEADTRKRPPSSQSLFHADKKAPESDSNRSEGVREGVEILSAYQQAKAQSSPRKGHEYEPVFSAVEVESVGSDDDNEAASGCHQEDNAEQGFRVEDQHEDIESDRKSEERARARNGVHRMGRSEDYEDDARMSPGKEEKEVRPSSSRNRHAQHMSLKEYGQRGADVAGGDYPMFMNDEFGNSFEAETDVTPFYKQLEKSRAQEREVKSPQYSQQKQKQQQQQQWGSPEQSEDEPEYSPRYPHKRQQWDSQDRSENEPQASPHNSHQHQHQQRDSPRLSYDEPEASLGYQQQQQPAESRHVDSKGAADAFDAPPVHSSRESLSSHHQGEALSAMAFNSEISRALGAEMQKISRRKAQKAVSLHVVM
jgi:hypothetical protein